MRISDWSSDVCSSDLANGLPRLDVTPQALELLMAHGWRGNVRELENTMHRAVLLAQDGRIGPEAIMLTGQALNPAPQAAPAPGATAADRKNTRLNSSH